MFKFQVASQKPSFHETWQQIMSDSKSGSKSNLNESNMPLLDDVSILQLKGLTLLLGYK